MNTDTVIQRTDRILVTGASGFIGAKVVEVLLERGYANVRCMTRSSSVMDRLDAVLHRFSRPAGVEVVVGDLTSPNDCLRVAEGVAVVLHLAAGFGKSFDDTYANSVEATHHLIDAYLNVGQPVRFVNVSSFAVYSNLHMQRGALLDETSPIESAPMQRHDAYAWGKLKQEEVVRDAERSRGLRNVILRPGTVYGAGNPSLTGRIGYRAFGFFLHFGNNNELPLSHVRNCAEAIVLAGLVPGIDGEVFNVVDDERVTSAAFLRAYCCRVTAPRVVSVPWIFAYTVACLWELCSMATGGKLPPVMNRRRCAAEWKGNRYTNRRLRERLGWTPCLPADLAMQDFLSQFGTDRP